MQVRAAQASGEPRYDEGADDGTRAVSQHGHVRKVEGYRAEVVDDVGVHRVSEHRGRALIARATVAS